MMVPVQTKMTQQQIQIVRKTWKLMEQVDPTLVGDIFYARLFTEHPGLRKLFPKEMTIQYQKLINMLTWIVMSLGSTGLLKKELSAMGERHVKYGVTNPHYDYVGEALLWTLQQGLGNDWNEEVRESWAICFEELAEAMKPGQ
jgi:hemoglobin-like flavoprotein